MKTDIHPKSQQVTFKCECGAELVAGSTLKNEEFKLEVCSKCHPFFTGKQKVIDSSGRIEKFKKQRADALKRQEENAKKVKLVEDIEEEKAA